MTNLNIQLKNATGDSLFPASKAGIVKYADETSVEALKPAEAGAQVNVIEAITVDGVPVTVSEKTAAITLPTAAEYTVAKRATAAEGYAATYDLKKDGVAVGDAINIPKDMVVESGTVKVCETPDVPVEGYVIGDKYIDLVLANADSSHIYILVKDLVDNYTAGSGIDITNNVISANLAESDIPALHLAKITDVTASADELNVLDGITATTTELNVLDGITATTTELNYVAGVTSSIQEQLNGKVEANAAITGATKCKITYDSKGLVTGGADITLSDVTDVTASAAEVNVLDGITATTTELNYVAGVTSSIQEQLNGKQATITGAATSITSNNLEASKVLISDNSGKVAASSITTTQLEAAVFYEVLS